MAAAGAVTTRQDRPADVFQRVRVNIVAACRITGVSRRTIERWIKQGLVEWVRVPSGRRLIYADSLLRKPEPR